MATEPGRAKAPQGITLRGFLLSKAYKLAFGSMAIVDSSASVTQMGAS